MRRFDVDRHVADEQRLAGAAMRCFERSEDVLGCGLARAGDVGADDVAKEARQIEEFEDLARERGRLVRADRHRHAGAIERRQRGFDIGEDARLLAADLVVARLEGLGRAGRRGVGVERAAQQAFETFTNKFTNRFSRKACEAVFSSSEVDGVGKRGVRVDKRAVEVEQDCAITKRHRGDRLYYPRGMRRGFTILFFIAATALADEKPNALTIVLEPLGDNDTGVVTRTTFRFATPTDVPEGVPLAIIGSISEGGQVVKRFRYPLLPAQRESLSAIQTLQPG